MIPIPGDLTAYLSAGLFVIGAYLAAVYFGIIVYAYRDIRSRSRDILAHILTVFLMALFNIPGLLIYLLVRPKEKLSEAYERSLAEEAVLQELEVRRICPGCQRRAEADFVVCPYCRHQLHLRCVSCSRLIDPEWDICPYCGHLTPGNGETRETAVAKPAAVAVAPEDADETTED